MIGGVDVSNRDIADAVAAGEQEMLELLAPRRGADNPRERGTVRYLLQACETVAQARAALARLPYQLTHSLTVVDRTGEFVKAYLSLDRGVVFRDVPVATNHQEDVEWHEHANATRSLERERQLASALERASDPQGFAAAFLAPPLFSVDYAHGMGTLYTAVYRPRQGSAEYRWPGQSWEHSFERFREGELLVRLVQPSAA